MATPDMDVIKEIPGYKVILKAVLKSQIQQLVEQLAASTDEESVILTASVSDGTLSHLGSDSGKNFLEDHEDIKSQFLGFCLKRHHIKKQEKEREKQEALLARAAPVTPPRYGGMAGPRGGYMPQRSPRFTAPHQQGPLHPVALRATAGSMRVPASGSRHEPYPTQRPERRGSGSFDQTSVPNQRPPQLQRSPSGNGQVIKVEADDEEQSNQSAPGASSQDNSEPASPAVNPSTPLHSDRDEDSKSSVSNAPNESDLKHDSIPPGGLSLDSDLSSLIAGTTSRSTLATNDSVQDTSAVQGADDPNVSVKLEDVDESDMDLEITGVELGQTLGRPPGDLMGSQDWTQGLPMQGGAAGGPSDMAGYMYDSEEQLLLDNLNMAYPTQQCKPVSTSPGRADGNPNQSTPIQMDVLKHFGDIEIHCKKCSLNLSDIMRLQGDAFVLACPTCGEALCSRKDNRIMYYICRFCAKRERDLSDLRRHERAVHTGERPFVCQLCERAFVLQRQLDLHYISKHNTRFVKMSETYGFVS